MRNIFSNFKMNFAPTLLRLAVFMVVSAMLLAQTPAQTAQAAPPPSDVTIVKTIEGGITTAQVGDVIRYRLHFQCSSFTTPCGQILITDVLPVGLNYKSSVSSVPAGFTMSYDGPSHTITITKDDNNLLDGSQYDAVIAAQVDYDLRPLPQNLSNTASANNDPTRTGTDWQTPNTSPAPDITITGVTPAWSITKTLYSPTINPTVDTDVTYQINLCPTTTSGNVALSNISIVDTLPAGAAFVSASNGGAYAPGPGTVTWSVAGTFYPPNCVTRYVTIRYNSPSGTPPGPFTVPGNVTNTVNFDGDYIPSIGPCTSPCLSDGGNINHDIDPIAEVPTYSKDDTGDPVGLTGTARFILHLDTNHTNYPSNDLILVDNLPPQLKVTGVTSGGWSAAFDYVQAHVEYSTNNGSSYTEFAGSPVSYNTNILFAAPAANITNVRWRFEYDPDKALPLAPVLQQGLPYTWAFTSSPEIRVTPRDADTPTDLPTVVTLPAAVAGNTYDNCLWASRTDSNGNPVTYDISLCNIEQMTVQGDMVSLRASKNETPGMPWDDLSDPTILSFTPDTKILPGDTVKYTLTVELTERSSEDLVNPTIQDTLPGDVGSPVGPDFVFVRNGAATLDGGAVAAPSFSQVGQVLTWHWNSLTVSPLPLGSHYLTVEFYGYVPRGQDPGTYTNNLYALTNSNAVVCEIGSQVADSGDVDSDGNTTEFGCRNPDNYVVERSAALRGEKWIRSISPDNNEVVLASTFLPDASCPDGGTDGLTSIPTNPFTRYPCIAQAFPENALSPNQYAPPPGDPDIDDFEYNLRIFNDGNVPMLKYVLYDILPRVGDTGSGGVLVNAARQSEFRPAMTGPIQFIQGPGTLVATDFTIEYNMTTNPCRPEVFDQPIGATVPGGCDNTWVLDTGVADWSLVRSYRIRLNNNGSTNTPSIANAVPAGDELRFGVPLHILADAPPAGFDTDDALSREIAWNSFSHVGSYDKNTIPPISIEDLLASEPRKVGITVPERMSVGNRVWRDADNSGTINAPDDTAPGIANVTVNLYRDVNNDGVADDNGAPGLADDILATTSTDTEGYYLFSNIPYDSDINNDRFIIGVPAGNFNIGGPLEALRSSTGTPAIATYTAPTSNVIDSADDGKDPLTPGQEVFSWSFTLQPPPLPGGEPTNEVDLSNNNRDGLAGQRRGVNGERDYNSDLTVDFGFFGGTDVPFSIGNHVWKDNGQTAAPGVFNYAERNDGIRQTDEPPVVGALVRLYRDGNANGIPEPAEMIRTDTTDADGFYLFDNLDPGPYYVEIAASNFQTGGPLAGWYSSQPTGTENVGVPGNTNLPNMDSDDNGVNNNFPEINGIFSGVVVLTRGVPEQLGETYISQEADPGSPANQGYNPTGWDGPFTLIPLDGSRGRFGETDATSNLTIDFGFIPPMSLGNRVWIDEGAGTTPFRTGYNNGIQDGTEVGVNGVTVQLWRDTNGTPGLQTAGDTIMYSATTDATGYYLFERMQPANDYFIYLPAANFTGAGPLVNYLSSTDTAAPADDAIDKNDNGVDNPTPAANGIASQQIAMSYNGEPLTVPAPGGTETDINNSGPYGPQNVGNYGQEDGDSNLTMDFGFVRPPRSIGNRLWIDTNNNGVIDGGDGATPGIANAHVSLYLDANGDGIPDDFNGDTILDGSDAIAFDLTDANGYYLFDDLPPNKYIVGVDYTNFAGGGPLEGYASSSGMPRNAIYTNPPITNPDSADHGIDRLQMGNLALSPYGILSASLNLTATPAGAPTGETVSGDINPALGFNPTAGDGPASIGRYGETDANSNLAVDFGFFIPMSIGNRVFKDDGTGGGTYNNGIMDGGELPASGVRVELWRDNAPTDGVPDAGGMVDFDTTDAGGYYLFDDLTPGSYVVVIPSSNFTGAGPLVGYNTSTPHGTDTVGVTGDPYTPATDRDNNGLNVGTAPTVGGVRSGTITLAYNTEAASEAELSGQADPGSPADLAFDPTGWDGPLSRGRWEEKDANSDLTVDFGFIPVYSLGNRVWFDTNNSSAINGAEVGINGVKVQLFASDGTTEIITGKDGILYTADDGLGPDGVVGGGDDGTGGMPTAGGGYYLFNDLPQGDYIVKIPASNFAVGQPLHNAWSSGTTISNAGVITETAAPDPDLGPDGVVGGGDDDRDSDDNGTRVTSGPSTGDIVSLPVTLGPGGSEPTTDNDPATNPQVGEQPNNQSNRTVDFGFYTITLGNVVWGDTNNNGLLAGGETGINGVTVELWSQDLSTLLASTTTAGGGIYTFTGLAQGNYIVRLPATNFNVGGVLHNYRSSTGAVPPSTYEPAPNPDINITDSDDNGTETGGNLGLGGYIQTSAFALTPAGEQAVNNGTGLTTENRVDFGVVQLVALGNRVWFDTGAGAFSNNGILDAGEVGVDNVRVQLYTSTGIEVPVGPDGILGTADDALGGMLTSGGGYYSFDRLYPGIYYAFIPATQFQAGGPLFTYFSSAGGDTLEVRDETVLGGTDENGIDDAAPATNGIRSSNFTLSIGGEQTGEGQSNYTGTLPDANVNFTDDFGFVQKYSIGNRIWLDTDNSGTINGSEVGKDGVVVNLYSASNLAVILATKTTANGGYYLFDDLYPGDYVVSVAASNFSGPGVLTGYWSSATSRSPAGAITETTAALANSDTESDDNGTLQTAGLLNGAVISSTVTLGPSGLTEPTAAPGGVENDFQPVVGQGNQADGRANMTVDFGFYKTEIGNLVFADADVSGHYNAGDTVLQNVTVQLYAANGTTLITSTTTNAGGIYDFDGQPAANYVVKVVTPAGMTSTIDTYAPATTDNANPNINFDNNDNGIGQGAGTVAAGTLTTSPGSTGAQANNTINNATGTTTDTTVDFGFVPLYSLGNRVWFDTNNNGVMDAGEVGVNGVAVELYHADGSGNPTGVVVATDITTTGALGAGYEGFYRFDDLFPGDYVVVIKKSNFASGGALAGYWSSATSLTAAGAITETPAPDADTPPETDADDNGTRDTSGGAFDGAVLSQAVTLGPSGGTEPTGEVATQLESGVLGNQGNQPDDHANMTVDFGFYKVEIGNLVYLDNNGNGNYDGAPDTVISGATVQLFSSNGTEIKVGPDGILGTLDDTTGGMFTNGAGNYLFSGLPAGDYIVKTVSPAGLSSTIDTYAPAGTDIATPDNHVDNNDNGVGIGFGTVSANLFNMNPGEFGSSATGATTDLTLDFGFVGQVAIGNRVWFDTGTGGGIANNGILDGGETGVPDGVVVELHKSSDNSLVASTTTGSVGANKGFYQFDQLYPGAYYVKIPATQFQSGKPLETYYSTIGSGANETSDENADENGIDDAALTTNGIRSQDYVLSPGTEQTGEGQSNYSGVLPDNSVNFTADFGFTHLVAIGNRVWFDNGAGGGTANDGKQNGGELGAPGVRVELYTSGNTLVNFTTTDASGNYQFDNLVPGQYYIHIPASEFQVGKPLEDYVSSTGNGSDETSDQDVDENGIDAVSLPTTGISTPVYDLQPNSETITDDQTGYTGYLTNDNVNFTADFGFLQKVAIGNTVWLDNGAGGGAANDGKQNGTEPGIPGVALRLYHVGDTPGVTTPVASTISGASGYYVFDDLLPGNYFVFIPPTEFQAGGPLANYLSSANNGNDETTDQTGDENGIDSSTPSTTGIRSTNYNLQPNTAPTGEPQPNYTGALDDNNVNFTADFGFTELVAIGNRVWKDTGAGAFYNNGILDAGEVGVDNVTVQLYTSAGVEVPVGPDGILGTLDDAPGGMVTSGGGYYRFDRLLPGAYYVQIPAAEFQAGGQLLGYVSSLGAGANDTSDQNVDENGIDVATLTTTGIRTQDYTLLPNTEVTFEDQSNYTGALDDNNVNFTADFGFTELVAIGNRIWFDNGGGPGGVANDGKQNGTEAGVPSVNVELYHVGDTPGVTAPVATTSTDAGGNYQFTNLNPGDYFVHIPASEFQVGKPLEDSVSSSGNGSDETSDQNADENGIDAVSLPTTGINSTPYTLTPNNEVKLEDQTSYTGYLDDDNVNFTADFGFLQKVAIGNTVWLDNGAGGGTANDGKQNGTEPGISGVALRLYHVGDTPGVTTPVATTTTDASGYYVFDDLVPGNYFVFIPPTEFQAGGPLANYLSSTGNGADETTDQTGDENGIDSATPSTTGIRSTDYTLQPNTEVTGEPQPNYTGALDDNNVNFTADFGFTELVAIGNRVWKDTGAGAFYNNGILDAGEVGVDNVTVQLYTSAGVEVPVGPDGILGTLDDAPGGMVTSGGGYYRFDRLLPGAYYVQIPASEFQAGGDLAGYVSSLGAGANDTSDQNVDENGIDVATLTTTGIRTQDYTLLPNTEVTGEDQSNYTGALDDNNVNFTADFGFTELVAIGNRIWFDTGNGGGTANDGKQNGTEAGVPSVNVELYHVGDTPGVTAPVATTSTDAGGNYQFTNLNPGDYFVHIPASEFQVGKPLEGYVSTTDVNPKDETSDQDVDENGIDAVSLPTTGISSTPYTLTPNTERAGEDQASYTGYLDDDNVNFTADFGFLQKVAIGNTVWLDNGAGGGTANDGKQNGTEPGIPGVDLQLYHVGDTPGVTTPVKTTTTGASGYYFFDDLLPGDYFVFIPPTEFQAAGTLASYISSVDVSPKDETTDQSGDENGIDDAAPATNGIRSSNYTLQPNTQPTGEPQPNYTGALDDNNVNFTADFGFVEKYSLGNRVWFDTNNNGLIDLPTEKGASGVTVELYAADISGNPTGAALMSATTVAGGYYLFDDLYGGDYVVVIPATNFTTGVLQGYWSSGTTISPAGIPSETPANDADTNNSDVDDNGMKDVSGGAFNGAVVSQDVVLGPTGNTEPTGETDLQPLVGQGTEPDGRANMTVDFGFYTQTLGNLVWSDFNKDGHYDSGTESGLDGMSIELWSGDGSTQLTTLTTNPVTTAGGGLYKFTGLPQGDYIVKVAAPVGTISSVDTYSLLPPPGDTLNPNNNVDDNDNGVGTGSGPVSSNAVTLTPGLAQTSNTVNNATGSTANPSIDFGFTPVFSLGNRVWFDTDNSGTINGSEVGISGVTVNLYAASDLTTSIATQTTDINGYYLFNGLQAGDYVVSIDKSNFGGVLNGYWSSGTVRSNPTGALTEATTATANTDIDSDDNGTRQTSGALNDSVTSSVVTLGPTASEPTLAPLGTETDIPASGQGQPDAQANMTVDFGFYTIKLGDLVWKDLDNSGLLDAPDGATPGFDGVTVELWSQDGSTQIKLVGPDGIPGTADDVPASTTTAGGGLYKFTGLPAGDYIVRLPAVNFNPTGVLRDYRSSTGPLPVPLPYEPGPDADTDTTNSDDNGSEVTPPLLGLGGYIETQPVTLTPAAEESSDDTTGTTQEFRVDFGVNNSPQIDLKVTKTDNQLSYAAGQTLNYVIVVTNKGPADANGMTVSDARPAQITSWTWTCAIGTPAGYNCTGDATNPATFTDTLDLPQLASVTYNVVAQVAPAATGDLVNSVTVVPPPGMTDMFPPDNRATDTDITGSLIVTKDDGVEITAPGATLTYVITATNNGAADLTGVQLVDSIPPYTTFVSATGGGVYASGKVTWPLFNLTAGASTQRNVSVMVADKTTLETAHVTSLTNVVDIQDDGLHTGGFPLKGEHTDTDQIILLHDKQLTGTNQPGSATPNVLIGEILDYKISIVIPSGTINNLKVLDVLDHGLAFVSCADTDPIPASGLTLQHNPCTDPNYLKVETEPVTDTNPKSVNAGRRVTFTFGQVQNTTASTQILIVNYRVIVLDIKDNVNGVSGLNNKATWTWEGGEITDVAPPVKIVEPDLKIDKTIDHSIARLGSIVTYTIEIAHTSKSTAPAYDVLVTDKVPPALSLIQTSIRATGSSDLPTPVIKSDPHGFTVEWASFPVGATAKITFQARFIGPSPVVNKASVEWLSIPIDPNPHFHHQSKYNEHSTERGYDPEDLIPDDYNTESSVELKAPEGGLPRTGFAPGVQTILPVQPFDKAYDSLGDIWLEIPALGLKMPIVGIPTDDKGNWDLTWLSDQAGYLEGTTFPTQVGTTGLTGHVYLADGTPGPFLRLGDLIYGNQVILHANGQRYIYEVRTSRVVLPKDLSVFDNDGYTWLTLLTCKDYIPSLKTYDYRLAVRAVLVSVEAGP